MLYKCWHCCDCKLTNWAGGFYRRWPGGGGIIAGDAVPRGAWHQTHNRPKQLNAIFQHAQWAKIQDQGGQTVYQTCAFAEHISWEAKLREGVRRNNATFVMQSQLHKFRTAATGGQYSAICKPEKLFGHWSLHFPSSFELSECNLDLGLIQTKMSEIKKMGAM